MRNLRKILLPIGWIYGGITSLRNFLYDKGWLSSEEYDFPVIGVGNLSVGGTGKSPMTEYIIRLLQGEYSLATLSRGYGRKTEGFRDVYTESRADQVGDEPLQFKRKFPDIQVVVDEQRKRGIRKLRKRENQPEVIILDDVFQHRKVKPGYLILLTAQNDIFFDDLILPAGNLREFRNGAERADCIIVTKCTSDLEEPQLNRIRSKIRKYASAPIFFTSITYGNPQNDSEIKEWSYFLNFEITLVTGIAKPEPLLQFLNTKEIRFEHLEYGDHHNFKPAELAELDSRAVILCTEKDYVRLSGSLLRAQLFYIPIEVRFLQEAVVFDSEIRKFILRTVR